MRNWVALVFGLCLAAGNAAAQGMEAAYNQVLANKDDVTALVELRAQLAQTDAKMPKNQRKLDKLLADKQPRELLQALAAADTYDAVLADMNWERVNIYNGANIAVAFAYMSDLQRATPPDPSGEGLRDTGVMMGSYLIAVIKADGARCADPSAPAKRLQQLRDQYPQVWAHAARLPKERLATAKYIGLISEIATAQLRGEDEVLCAPPVAEGLLGIMQGLQAEAEKPGSMKCTPGQLGRDCVLPNPAAKFRPEAEWRPKQEAARRAMPGEIDRWISGATP